MAEFDIPTTARVITTSEFSLDPEGQIDLVNTTGVPTYLTRHGLFVCLIEGLSPEDDEALVEAMVQDFTKDPGIGA